jgi:hypothetical protein
MKSRFGVLAAVLLAFTVEACSRNLPTMPSATDPAAPERAAMSAAKRVTPPQVFRAAGDITPRVNAFRDALGTLNGNLPGSRADGRREINWDAVPAQFTNTNDFPADFFNQPVAGRARGTVFATPGTGFRTSDNNFTDLNPAFATEFNFFSPIRTFAPVGSNRMTVNFFVPGANDAALSTGFGVVFSDVDREGSASIRLFDSEGNSLGRFSAPTSPGGLSFVGVIFPDARVARVEIVSGQAAVSPNATDVGNRRGDDDDHDGDRDDRDDDSARILSAPTHDHDDRDGDHRRRRDLVIMDDFIYGEPLPIFAPQTQVAAKP